MEEFQSWLNHGAEVNRSLWDRKSLIAHLDIEYVNFDHPAYPYLAAEQIFELQRPVVSAAKSLFEAISGLATSPSTYGTRTPFRLENFQSTHRAFAQLSALGRMSASLQRLYASMPGTHG